MKQKEKSNGSPRGRWAECWVERIAGPASAEEMRMWPLMLRTLALSLRAGIPLQEAVHANPGSGQLGESGQFGENELVQGAGKTHAKKTTARKSTRLRRARSSSPLSEDYGQKRCAEDIRRFTQALATVTSWGAPAHLACAQLLENSARMRPHSRERLHDLQLSLRMSESAGAPLATSLERAAEHAEERIDALLGRQSALAAPRATGRILSWLPLLGLGLGVLMGSDPVGVLTGSILGALTGLLGLGLAFAGRRWTAVLVHRAEVESAASSGAEQTSNVPPVDTALVLELLAAQLRAGLAPLAALGTLAEALNSRPLHTVCQRLQMGSGWGSAWSGSAAGTFGELRDALAPAYTGGAPSTALLLSLADAHRLSERRAAERAAGRLSVALVVPLGLCSLPAFICLGIVPILISLLPTLTG
ncbi:MULTISPECIES: type II secretion system F family protein [unclassified Rothia (in: high G+C Gram-positive bacteria)]|uniref:type II secretion system F family protein n=1 Tax=unclassified Rothia (in: high G+C Gram-positive bacteria) TaxID=2689056 RepID=UPI0008A34F4C|nr:MULTISPECIES: type II secretion system F family protein [unclassified Rothia (in: high G+C Gram-positive bacteria)]OFP58551.1 type II secretion protein F [Rothia sp. HMSC076D04]OHP56207.1 type II secretion protein F [Rothia sp. HMSC061D12]